MGNVRMNTDSRTWGVVALALFFMLVGGCAAGPKPETRVSVDCQWHRGYAVSSSRVELLEVKRYPIQRQTLGVHELFNETLSMTYRIEYTLEGTWTGWHEDLDALIEPQWAVDHIDLRFTATSLILDEHREVWEEGRPIELSVEKITNLGRSCLIEFDVSLIHPHPNFEGRPAALPPLPVEVYLKGDGTLSAHGFPMPMDAQPGLPFVYMPADVQMPDYQHTISRGLGDQGNEVWELKDEGWHRVDDVP